jgi:hypothetical protein
MLHHNISYQHQTPNPKHQTLDEFDFLRIHHVLNFGHWYLFVIWDLLFGISSERVALLTPANYLLK